MCSNERPSLPKRSAWPHVSHCRPTASRSISAYAGDIFDLAGGPQCALADLNCDGTVDGLDLLILLSNWG